MNATLNTLSESDLIHAREVFRRHESRDLFYRAALELVRLAIGKQTEITVAEALGTLLQTWNKSFYRFHGTFDESHVRELENLIDRNQAQLITWRKRSSRLIKFQELKDILRVFESFEILLGPIGAAKALHLLAPRFFPLWDRAIARHYGVRLKPVGKNGENYLRFMQITNDQISSMTPHTIRDGELLKMIDEYNYCSITKHWL
jgi:hypothetical protein